MNNQEYVKISRSEYSTVKLFSEIGVLAVIVLAFCLLVQVVHWYCNIPLWAQIVVPVAAYVLAAVANVLFSPRPGPPPHD